MAGKWGKMSAHCKQIEGLPFKFNTRPLTKKRNVFVNPETNAPYFATCLNPLTQQVEPLISVLSSNYNSSDSLSQESNFSPPPLSPSPRTHQRHHPYARLQAQVTKGYARRNEQEEDEEEEANQELLRQNQFFSEEELSDVTVPHFASFSLKQCNQEEEEFHQLRDQRLNNDLESLDQREVVNILKLLISKVNNQ